MYTRKQNSSIIIYRKKDMYEKNKMYSQNASLEEDSESTLKTTGGIKSDRGTI